MLRTKNRSVTHGLYDSNKGFFRWRTITRTSNEKKSQRVTKNASYSRTRIMKHFSFIFSLPLLEGHSDYSRRVHPALKLTAYLDAREIPVLLFLLSGHLADDLTLRSD